jgi:ferredoxin--NADP+ reductase
MSSGRLLPAPPLRIAVVGSGPAGFFAAGQLLAAPDTRVTVDMFDRLATPWGLVRSGVAPDHQKIKSVTRVFEETATRPGFRFHGNVEVGIDVTAERLAAAYDAVIYAVGAAQDRPLGVPGENLAGSHAATAFVGWYNGHPDFADRNFDLSHPRAIVIGNGNVALDVARLLAIDPGRLASTDIADHALAVLRRSAIEEIVILGRRGPAQAAFTNAELSELAACPEVDLVIRPSGIALDHQAGESDAAGVQARTNVDLVRELASRRPSGAHRRIVLHFLASPQAILGAGHVHGVRVDRTQLVMTASGVPLAQPTGRTEVLEAGLVLRSIGYRGTPIPGIPFDRERGTIANDGGRVRGLPGAYTAGWIKRGPSGVIGTNKRCARETVTALLEDHAAGRLPRPDMDSHDLLASLRDVVDYEGWLAIDRHERGLGRRQGRPRVKLVRREELLTCAVRQAERRSAA